MTENEQKAIDFSNDKEKLREELFAMRKCLVDKIKKDFGKGKFDFENKRLLSDKEDMALQWKLRRYPNEEISYENQQTNIGKIEFQDLRTYDRETKIR
jgi:hypothetical protein